MARQRGYKERVVSTSGVRHQHGGEILEAARAIGGRKNQRSDPLPLGCVVCKSFLVGIRRCQLVEAIACRALGKSVSRSFEERVVVRSYSFGFHC